MRITSLGYPISLLSTMRCEEKAALEGATRVGAQGGSLVRLGSVRTAPCSCCALLPPALPAAAPGNHFHEAWTGIAYSSSREAVPGREKARLHCTARPPPAAKFPSLLVFAAGDEGCCREGAAGGGGAHAQGTRRAAAGSCTAGEQHGGGLRAMAQWACACRGVAFWVAPLH